MPLNSDKILGDLIAKQQKIIKQLTQIVKLQGQYNTAIAGASNVKALNTEVNNLNETQKRYIKTVEQAIKIDNESTKVSNKQKTADFLLAKAKEEKRRYSKAVTEQAKKEIAEEKKEIGTLQKLINRNNIDIIASDFLSPLPAISGRSGNGRGRVREAGPDTTTSLLNSPMVWCPGRVQAPPAFQPLATISPRSSPSLSASLMA